MRPQGFSNHPIGLPQSCNFTHSKKPECPRFPFHSPKTRLQEVVWQSLGLGLLKFDSNTGRQGRRYHLTQARHRATSFVKPETDRTCSCAPIYCNSQYTRILCKSYACVARTDVKKGVHAGVRAAPCPPRVPNTPPLSRARSLARTRTLYLCVTLPSSPCWWRGAGSNWSICLFRFSSSCIIAAWLPQR